MGSQITDYLGQPGLYTFILIIVFYPTPDPP